jgi:hypothetical protein
MTTGLDHFGAGTASQISMDWRPVLRGWSSTKEIVPITGAGVGANFKLPDWFHLTERLCDAVEEITGAKTPELRGERDLMVKAFRCTHRLQKLHADDPGHVIKIITGCLYHDFTVSKTGIAWLECIYLLAKHTGLHLTLNFDDVFETYVNAVHDTKAVVSSAFQTPRRVEGQIDSYHLHGIIPISADPSRESELVFDTISYIERYAEVIDRLSTALLYVFTTHKCIFLGLSMVDPNLLRLIRMSRQLRSEPDCWGIVFGPIVEELKPVLESWGLAVVDATSDDKFDFDELPNFIIGQLRNIDPPNVEGLFAKFKAIYERKPPLSA